MHEVDKVLDVLGHPLHLLAQLLAYQPKHAVVKPGLVGVCDKPVGDHSRDLVSPKVDCCSRAVDHSGLSPDHAQPHPGQVAHVEDVVELGRGGQHLLLGGQPQLPGERHKLLNELRDWDGEAAIGVEMATCDCAEDVVDGLLGGDRAVVDDEVALQSVGDVVPPSSRMVHRSKVLDKDIRLNPIITYPN